MAFSNEQDLLQFWNTADRKSENKAFTRKLGDRPIKIAAGTQLYKYSKQRPYIKERGRWSPWWHFRYARQVILTDGTVKSVPSLEEIFQRADGLGARRDVFTRVRSAVKFEWNELSRLFIAEVMTPTWAMFGQCSGQRITDSDPDVANVFFIGGNFQVYIPELTQHDLRLLNVH